MEFFLKTSERKISQIRFPDSPLVNVKYLETEKTMIPDANAKSVRLDVLFEDENAWYVLEMQDYSLWLAEYGDVPTFRYAFNCLQYSDAGQIDGIPAAVDLDLLFLDEGGDKANADATQGKT